MSRWTYGLDYLEIPDQPGVLPAVVAHKHQTLKLRHIIKRNKLQTWCKNATFEVHFSAVPVAAVPGGAEHYF